MQWLSMWIKFEKAMTNEKGLGKMLSAPFENRLKWRQCQIKRMKSTQWSGRSLWSGPRLAHTLKWKFVDKSGTGCHPADQNWITVPQSDSTEEDIKACLLFTLAHLAPPRNLFYRLHVTPNPGNPALITPTQTLLFNQNNSHLQKNLMCFLT